MAKIRSRECDAFGTVVRALRESVGLSQEELAARTGLHRTYIGSVERGERNVSLQNIYRIAESLGITVASLMKRVDNLLK